jgi:hypothetical protein
VGRKHRELARGQPNGAFSNDHPAIAELLKGVVWQVKKHFRRAKRRVDFLVNCCTVIRRPTHNTLEFLVEFVRLIDEVIHKA